MKSCILGRDSSKGIEISESAVISIDSSIGDVMWLIDVVVGGEDDEIEEKEGN